jgi:hypothetical protein
VLARFSLAQRGGKFVRFQLNEHLASFDTVSFTH